MSLKYSNDMSNPLSYIIHLASLWTLISDIRVAAIKGGDGK